MKYLLVLSKPEHQNTFFTDQPEIADEEEAVDHVDDVEMGRACRSRGKSGIFEPTTGKQ